MPGLPSKGAVAQHGRAAGSRSKEVPTDDKDEELLERKPVGRGFESHRPHPFLRASGKQRPLIRLSYL